MRIRSSFACAAAVAASLAVAAPPAAAEPSKLAPEVGFNYGEIETARTTALGGAVRASGSGTSAIYANPASLAITRVYHLEALAAIWPEAKRQTYGASAMDSITSRLAGGIGGHYGIMDPDGVKRKWTDARLALAFPFSEKLSAGLTGRYLKVVQDGLGPLGSSLASNGDGNDLVSGFSFDAGLTLRPNDSLSFALVGQNLSNPGTGLQPTTFGGGLAFGSQDFTFEADVVGDFTSFTTVKGEARTTVRAMGGFEYLAADHYPLRLGYRFDQGARSHAISGGLGYIDTQFGLEVGVRRTVAGPELANPATAVVIGLQYYLESTGITRAPVPMGD